MLHELDSTNRHLPADIVERCYIYSPARGRDFETQLEISSSFTNVIQIKSRPATHSASRLYSTTRSTYHAKSTHKSIPHNDESPQQPEVGPPNPSGNFSRITSISFKCRVNTETIICCKCSRELSKSTIKDECIYGTECPCREIKEVTHKSVSHPGQADPIIVWTFANLSEGKAMQNL